MEVREQLNEFLTDIFNGILKLEEKSLKKYSDFSLSIAEMHIIEKIGMSKEIRMSDLAKAIRVTLGTVTVSINRLVKKGYIERSQIVHDRRVVLIKLTSKGTAVFRLHEIFHKKMVDEIVLGLTPNEENILAKALGNLAHYFKGLELKD